jgi:hypothetical protein
MDTEHKIRALHSLQGSSVTLIRTGGEEVRAHITRIDGEGDDAICTFMDVSEGVERSLSVTEIDDIKVT